ncbi:hypothetical protein FH972_022532 [Carpinus fangiana]|uniref:Pre-mRNA polyadenylation factor Fip1 domain-containing protein n=1 Tax=Carpinus fangiana TaxID=176857 RepID=A0A5N6KT24_9ROSI|nr:hypothetical protein FH972_022532 [Carpinus fangiana]
MEEDDDDIYGTAATTTSQAQGDYAQHRQDKPPTIKQEATGSDDGEEEGEESEDDSDSDIDIITEREPGAVTKPDVSQPPRPDSRIQIKAPPSESQQEQGDGTAVTRGKQSRPAADSKPGHEYPGVRVSNMDMDTNPVYEPVGKPITELEFDADLAELDKPWRRPGADQTDYFNYGFDEFTWATYCMKQKNMRSAIDEQKAESKQFEMMFGGAPGMGMAPPGAPAGPAQGNNMAQTGGMPEMPPEMMNAMMQQMMASGMDPSQMSPMDFANMMQQMNGGMPQPQAYGGGGGGSGGQGMLDQGHMQHNQGYGGRGRGRRGGRW